MAEMNFTENAFILGEGVMFIGTIEAPGVANINGTVKGDIKAADIKIGPKGEVSGQVEAHLIDVRGQLAELLEHRNRTGREVFGKVGSKDGL